MSLLTHLKENTSDLEKAFTSYSDSMKNNFKISILKDGSEIEAIITENEMKSLLYMINEEDASNMSLLLLSKEDKEFVAMLFDDMELEEHLENSFPILEFGVFVGRE